MSIPDADNATATREKVRGCLLNLHHPDGGSKAIWFHGLGYELEDWQLLADDLLEIARSCEKHATERSPYGVKYKASGTVGRPGYRPGHISTAWIIEPDESPRLVTA